MVQFMSENPTEDKFKQMVRSKLLTNSPVRLENITNTRTFFCPRQAGLWGKQRDKFKPGED